MPTLINLFIRICLFRAKPQDLPTSQSLLLLSGFALALSGIFGGAVRIGEEISRSSTMMFVLAQVATLGLLVWLILRSKKLTERWYQSVTALYGTQALLTLLTIPMKSWHIRIAGGFIIDNKLTVSLPFILSSLIEFWAFVVAIYIIRLTLETTRLTSFFLTLSIVFASTIIPNMLIPR